MFRAHQQNAQLFVSRSASQRARARDWAAVVGAAIVLAATLIVPIWLVVTLVNILFS